MANKEWITAKDRLVRTMVSLGFRKELGLPEREVKGIGTGW